MELTREQLEHRAEWVKALRSGEYCQATGHLRDIKDGSPCYCCLGVAADLYRKATPDIAWKNTGTSYDDRGTNVMIQGLTIPVDNHFLPGAVADYFGLGWTIQADLVHLNDSQHKNFAEIAEFIEAHPRVW